jgi:hypothetical protein
MKTYKYLTATTVAVFDEDGISRMSGLASIVPDGAVIEPADPPPIVISSSVTMRQARLALLQYGLLDQVNAAIAAMTGTEGEAARIAWEFSSMVERDQPLVQSLALVLGMTALELAELFAVAETL